MTKTILKSSVFLAAFSAFAAAAQQSGEPVSTSAAPASPIVVGVFVVLFVGAIAGFFVWMMRASKHGDSNEEKPDGDTLKPSQGAPSKPRT